MKNKTKVLINLAAFVLALLFCAFVAWCGGFNFDTRGPNVGCGVLMSVVFSTAVAAISIMVTNEL